MDKMGFFDWLTGARQERDSTPDQKLHAEIGRLTDRVDRVERDSERRELEWSEWFDKFRRLYASMSKRAQRERESEEAAGQAGKGPYDAPESTIPRPAGYGQPPQPRTGIASRRRAMRGF